MQDTAKTLRARPRDATGRTFNPVGHISLDDDDPTVADLGLNLAKEGVYWIKCLYVSTSIHGGGIGRQAMNKVEVEATEPPLNAHFLVLDTLHKDEFQREDFCLAYYGGAPKVSAARRYPTSKLTITRSSRNCGTRDAATRSSVRRRIITRRWIVMGSCGL